MPNLKSSRRFRYSELLLAALLAVSVACSKAKLEHHEYMYVSASETSLRDRVATLYGKVGTVHNGDRVEVLEKQRRFLRVRTDKGQEGWIEERSLVPQEVYDGFQQLAKDSSGIPVQAHGTTRAELNMHLTPARDGEHLYQLKEGEKLEVLKRATSDKNAKKSPPAAAPAKSSQPPSKNAKEASSGPGTPKPQTGAAKPVPAKASESQSAMAAAPAPEASAPKPIMEDWYLVRNPQGHVGWVLLRMVDLDVPLDVAQYAEGQRIMGYFVLNSVQESIDGEAKQEPQYLVLLNEPKDGLPWDYNQVRVFTRNRARHRYETAYRQRNLEGYLPVQVAHQAFDKEGDLPTFTIRTMNDSGQIVSTTYKLNGPIVRRVPSPEEEAAERAKHEAELAARQKAAEERRQKGSSAAGQHSPTHKKKHHKSSG